jgi:hypothetical protein
VNRVGQEPVRPHAPQSIALHKKYWEKKGSTKASLNFHILFLSFTTTPKATPKYQVSNCKNDSILALSILNTEAQVVVEFHQQKLYSYYVSQYQSQQKW